MCHKSTFLKDKVVRMKNRDKGRGSLLHRCLYMIFYTGQNLWMCLAITGLKD